MEISRFNLKWKGHLLQLMLLGVFSQIYPNSMESRLAPILHAVPMESRSNSKKIYCFVPYFQQTFINLKKKKVSGVIIFAICSADGPCFVLLPLRIDRIFEEILFLVEEFVCRKCNIPSTAKSLENNISCWGNTMSLDQSKYYFSMRKYYFSSNTEILFLRPRYPLLSSLYPSAISLNTKPSRKLKNKKNGCERKENI